MKVALGLMLLVAMLAGSAYAVRSGVPAEPLMSKGLSIQSEPVTKRNNPQQRRKSKSSGKVGAIKAAPKAKSPAMMTETPSESAGQSVQLRGVRG